MRLYLILIILLITAGSVTANDLRKARKALEKGEIDRAIDLLSLSLSQIPVNPGAKWMMAEILSVDTLNYYNLDTAYHWIQAAKQDFSIASESIRDELQKQSVDYSNLEKTFKKIEKLYFKELESTSDTTAFQAFLFRFPTSDYLIETQKSLDSLRFSLIEYSSNWLDFRKYSLLYPESFYSKKATQKYEQIYFNFILTKEKLWLSYVQESHPEQYKNKVFELLYKKISVFDDPEVWEKSILTYPYSNFTKRMVDRLLFTDKSRIDNVWDYLPIELKDSIIYVINEEKKLITPWPDINKFGFVDIKGAWHISPLFDSLVYPNTSDFFKFKWIVGWKNGQLNWVGQDKKFIPISALKRFSRLDDGLYVWQDSVRKLMFENGEWIAQNIDTAEWLDNRWIKVKKEKAWGIISTSGDIIAPYEYESIEKVGKFWIFKRQDRYAITNQKEIAKELGEGGVTLTFKFTDYELINDSLLLGYNEGQEALLNSELYFYIPWGNYEIYPSSPFHYARSEDQYIIFETEWKEKLGGDRFKGLIQSNNWVAVRDSVKWKAFQNNSLIISDSMYLITTYALVLQDSASRFLMFSNGFKLKINDEQILQRLAIKDSEYILIQMEQNKSIWARDGRVIFQGPYEKIELLIGDLFKVQYKNKYGLLNQNGFLLLDFEFDFIQEEGKLIQLLNQGKIGTFDPASQVILAENYDEGFSKFGKFYQTKKKGKYGLVDALNQVIVPFEYQKIMPIGDDAAWVMTDSSWAIYSWGDNVKEISGISQWSDVGNNTYVVLMRNGYGIYNLIKGWIISPVYTSCRMFSKVPLQWIGEFYFAEADYYVVSIYTSTGNKQWSASFPAIMYERILSY